MFQGSSLSMSQVCFSLVFDLNARDKKSFKVNIKMDGRNHDTWRTSSAWEIVDDPHEFVRYYMLFMTMLLYQVTFVKVTSKPIL
jgi:hypothetical protein